MNIEHFLHYENNRQAVYQLLSTCYSPPENGITLILADLEDAMQGIAPQAAEFIPPMKSNLRLRPLQVDHAALFVGPFELLAPPYGSVYLEEGRKIMGNSTIDAQHRYREAGLQVSDNFKEAPDHIVVELEFLHYLIFNEIEALDQYDIARALGHLETQNAFLHDHLGAWLNSFTENVEKNAQTNFYKNLALVTKHFVQLDHTNVTDVSMATLNALTTVVSTP